MALVVDDDGNFYDDGSGFGGYDDYNTTISSPVLLDDYGNPIPDELPVYTPPPPTDPALANPIYSDTGGSTDTTSYNSDGTINPGGTAYSSDISPADAAKLINADTSGFLKKLFTDKDGNLNLKALGGIGGGILGALGALSPSTKKVGYQGSIPKYDAVRNMVTAPPTRAQGYRPGQGGINYGGNVSYVPKGTAPTGAGIDQAKIPSEIIAPEHRGETFSNVGPRTFAPNELPDPFYQSPKSQLVAENDPFYQSPEYQEYQKNYGEGTAGTMDMYDSPYFGLLGSGSKGRGMDEAYKKYKSPTAAPTDGFSKLPESGMAPETFSNTGQNHFDTLLKQQEAKQQTDAAQKNNFDVDFVPDYTNPVRSKPVGPNKNYTPVSGGSDANLTDPVGPVGPVSGLTGQSAMRSIENMVAKQNMASGGIAGLARGRYLQGGTDGMADKIPARIGKDQPAALSHGEFVIPADVVSHLGNGNSDAGAKKLYSMMDKIRQARTGTKKQGKQINPDKFMPGGLAQAYASGGSVKRFNTGGAAVSGLGTAANAGVTGSETTPNTFAGEYIGDMLGRTKALATSPYQQYMGPLTAGESGLQSKVFSGLQNINFPGNLGASFSSAGAPTIGADGKPVGGGANPASQYMNPYLQSVLDPQMAELRRQNEITNMGANAKLTGAGAFGGGRQAIMNAENNRNLMQEMNKTVGAGYSNAFDKAMGQFNTEQARDLGLARFMSDQGGQQRGIEAEGIAADKKAFEEARKNPYEMLQFEQSMLQGMPISATNIETTKPSTLQEAIKGAGGLAGMFPNQSNVSFGDLTTAMKNLGFDI